MSLGRRIARAAVAVVALSISLIVTSPARAEPCTGAAAQAQAPAAQNVQTAPWTPIAGRGPAPNHPSPPTGHRPRGANEGAALPRLGQVSRSILGALDPRPQPVRQQAAAVPAPRPPATPNTQPPNAAQAAPAPAPAPPAPPQPPGTTLVGWVTGPDSPNDTVGRFAITGTDLGIMWDSGTGSQVLMAFGDTYGYCGVKGQQWRYNTLFRSSDRSLANTVSANAGAPMMTGHVAKQILNSPYWAPNEKGIIPTAAIAVGGKQIMNFMSIKSWDANGSWTTNFSGLAISPDNGENWGIYPSSVRLAGADRVAGGRFMPGNENFQQGAFLKPGPGDGYLYSFGTPAGRSGSAYLSRVVPADVANLTKYEYWNGDRNSWVPMYPGTATPVIPGPVGELSAQYNTHLKQYLALYCNGDNDVVARTAPAPQGPWGPEQLLVPSSQYPGGIYAPYLHPWSTGKELYYTLSLWSAYNVMLMKTVLP
ncbi:DUF4185 domain-containing protein [Mycobacterium sp. MYCO198283]|uniref:DUF4185 domain-containing protein n=1 Tax=Mycobacterium sp. MYCO198283 TaxID=2883505 RepID=UPI001E325118|nr:DUF4185 domain-containing protein [Mycobacterium sp. MYCO198283]MCG5431954.1 DUF4185 domain-containing protein [Mycobacterium sp. MYCO198283]